MSNPHPKYQDVIIADTSRAGIIEKYNWDFGEWIDCQPSCLMYRQTCATEPYDFVRLVDKVDKRMVPNFAPSRDRKKGYYYQQGTSNTPRPSSSITDGVKNVRDTYSLINLGDDKQKKTT